MSDNMKVRASRDGDQFHYLWAARRALQLLMPQSGLAAITIEGPSPSEFPAVGAVEAGEELIDIAEYFGSQGMEKATLVRYMQLKHSTLDATEAWPPSGLEKTIRGFAERYASLEKLYPGGHLEERLQFWFVTNRPISPSFVEAIEDAAMEGVPRHPHDLAKLKKFTSLEGAQLASFSRLLRFEGCQDDYRDQRNILLQDVSGYLPDLDIDAPTRLKELVTRKALSESATNPAITRTDILRALQTDESQLFPASCLIEDFDDAIPREQEAALVDAICKAAGTAVIIHADAGVGKSVFATRINARLPAGSVSVLYDCFGNGQYRSASGYRHRHRTAFVQIANQLAARGLCHPLIPTPNADPSAYMRAFLHRITQAVSTLRAQTAGALLCIAVDAADNAQMAAEEIGEPRSFVRDLLRETLPDHVCLAVLCRPHRESILDPPTGTPSLTLNAFSRGETAAHLRSRFPEATEHDVDEFHRLSSSNPRVQGLALSRKAPLPEILRLLGPNPTTVDSAIEALLERSIAKLRDAASQAERPRIDLICAGLAVLRPLVPLSVLATLSGVDQAAIRSFALDLGRPLIITGDTIQFFDEPAETWFRKQFRPDAASVRDFVTHLKALTSNSAYAAAALPQLMLEADQLSELVELALTSQGLPDASPVERRDIELQRLQFALKAALRAHRYGDAAKLALKAGGESAGEDRQRTLFRGNTDLVPLFMESNGVQELVSRRTFVAATSPYGDSGNVSTWIGSQHVYEAAVLSGHPDLIGEARGRLRMAEDWLRNWSRLPPDERQKEPVSDLDRAVMAMAHGSIHDVDAAADSLRRWTPRELSYKAGRIMARRLLDHACYETLEELALAARNDLGLLLAIAVETRDLDLLLPKVATVRAFRLLSHRRIKLESDPFESELALRPVTAAVECAYRHGVCDATQAVALLERYLPASPPSDLSSRYSRRRTHYMRAYALRAALNGIPLQLMDLASSELRKEVELDRKHDESQDLRAFKEDVGAILPWSNLWARSFAGQQRRAELTGSIAEALEGFRKIDETRYGKESHSSNEIANLWIDILLETGSADKAAVAAIFEWSQSLKRPLFTPTLNRLSRLCARTVGLEAQSFNFAKAASSLLQDESDPRSQADGYVDIARSILAVGRREAEAYFSEATKVVSRIGEENIDRWDALIDLAERAAKPGLSSPELAYRFSRCAEITRRYLVSDKYFAEEATTKALVGLCPSSSLAIISRWRDRRFGNDAWILRHTVEALIERGSINPLDAVPLFGFRGAWEKPKVLEAAISRCTQPEMRVAVLRFAYSYMTLEGASEATWRRLGGIATSAGVDLVDLQARIDAAAEDAPRKVAPSPPFSTTASEQREARGWGEVFAECDLTTPLGIAAARRRAEAAGPPFSWDEFYREAMRRTPVGREADFLSAFGAVADFDLYDLRTLLAVFPPEWKDRLSARLALATVVKGFCRRFWAAVTRSRRYQTLPLTLAAELSGLDESELIEAVLGSISESTELLGADRLFTLVGLLCVKLTSDDAAGTLSYGLTLFDSALEDSDGEGSWSVQLAPPTTVEEALAGYIWAGLASPVAATRWEAAHVVLGLCATGRTRVVAGLVEYAAGKTAEPFGGRGLAFYSLHGQQWFLIAAARAALSYGAVLVPHADHLLKSASAEQPHVFIRLLAARTVLALAAQGLVTLSADDRQRMLDINASPFERTKHDEAHDHNPRKTGTVDKDDLPESDLHFFGMDFGPDWLAPLGECFGLTRAEMERETLKVIRGDLGYAGPHRWDADGRARRHLYPDGSTHFQHSAYPVVDDHGFYLSYHAMMMTAGRLLATRPLVEPANSWDDNGFPEWIARHDISRTDGRWLADRRDPPPAGQSNWLKQGRAELPHSIPIDDFEAALRPSTGNLVVWGHWAAFNASYEEAIGVHTALVSRERSGSLLRALQTTHDFHNFRIPTADDDLQIDHGPYQLKGWILAPSSDRGIDESDPWAGDVRFPAPEPAAFVVETMGLTSDIDRRLWQAPSLKTPALRSETWGHRPEKEGSEQPSGRRLQALVEFVGEFLKANEMDLVVEVAIERRSRHRRYEYGNKDGFQAAGFRIFVVQGDGTIRTV